MNRAKLSSEGQLLRIFIGESDKYEGKPLYEWIVIKAKEYGLAGATVIRGIMGFGANSHIHTSSILRLSLDLPIIIELVDTKDKIENFLSNIENVIKEGLITVERANIKMYRSNEQKAINGTA